MKVLRQIMIKMLKKAAEKFGYELCTKGEKSVNSGNFVNLSRVYEHCLNGRDETTTIPENEIRAKLLERLLGTPPSEAYFIIQSLLKTCTIPGDVCEFGVAQGETSALIANEMAQFKNKKTLHLFDSFEGLPMPTQKDKLKDDILSLGNIESYHGKMSCPEEMVKSRLDSISFSPTKYKIHKGFIEELIFNDRELPKNVSLAYVDFDFYEPIKIVLEFLHNVTSSGSIIIIDDYDFFSTGVKSAVDEFICEKNHILNNYDFFVPNNVFGHFAIITKIN